MDTSDSEREDVDWLPPDYARDEFDEARAYDVNQLSASFRYAEAAERRMRLAPAQQRLPASGEAILFLLEADERWPGVGVLIAAAGAGAGEFSDVA